MRPSARESLPWVAAWLLAVAAGVAVLGLQDRARQQEGFENQARIAHRLLSQRAAQHDAVLATLALLQPAPGSPGVERLPAVYPQVLAVRQRLPGAEWDLPGFDAAQDESRQQGRPVLAAADLAHGRAWLLLAAQPASFAIQVDLLAAVPWSEWPMPRDTSPVRVVLERSGQVLPLQPGTSAAGAGTLSVRKPLASASHPFDFVATRTIAWSELPWTAWLLWTLACAAMVLAAAAWRRQREARRRAEELLRLGQVGRLNTLGELAGGLAHELNQPLTALLASTQAARRLLDDEPADTTAARAAMEQAAQQARRAADVVARLRRTIERPGQQAVQALLLQDAVRNAFRLLAPEFARRQVEPQLQGAVPVRVQAEPVALEQILHNLLMNALQALEEIPAAERQLVVDVQQRPDGGGLSVQDNGPGIPPDVLPRLFQPFVTTRQNGLGLGLSLCEGLAQAMGGSLQAGPQRARGASFTLVLPAAA